MENFALEYKVRISGVPSLLFSPTGTVTISKIGPLISSSPLTHSWCRRWTRAAPNSILTWPLGVTTIATPYQLTIQDYFGMTMSSHGRLTSFLGQLMEPRCVGRPALKQTCALWTKSIYCTSTFGHQLLIVGATGSIAVKCLSTLDLITLKRTIMMWAVEISNCDSGTILTIWTEIYGAWAMIGLLETTARLSWKVMPMLWTANSKSS